MSRDLFILEILMSQALRSGQAVSSEVVDWLAQSAVFAGLGQAPLGRFAESSEVCSYDSLDEAVVEGEVSTALNIVISGRFIVLLPTNRLTQLGDNAMLSLDSYVAGDSFGEASLIASFPSPEYASIIAMEPSLVLSLTRELFERAINADARVGQVIYRNLFEIQTRRLRGPS